jgi:hypothetical protein
MNPCINPVPEIIPEHEETDTLRLDSKIISHFMTKY